MDQFFAIFAQTFATFAVNGFQLFQQPQLYLSTAIIHRIKSPSNKRGCPFGQPIIII
jgi:hypothetical protein